jgi:hypothetical protein
MAGAEFAQERLAEASIIWERLENQLAWHSDRSRSGKSVRACRDCAVCHWERGARFTREGGAQQLAGALVRGPG